MSGWCPVDWRTWRRLGLVGRNRIRWLVFGVSSLAFVFYVRDVSVTVSPVVDDLGAVVRESDSIRSGDYISVAVLRMGKVFVGSVVIDALCEVVGHRISKCIIYAHKYSWKPRWKQTEFGLAIVVYFLYLILYTAWKLNYSIPQFQTSMKSDYIFI